MSASASVQPLPAIPKKEPGSEGSSQKLHVLPFHPKTKPALEFAKLAFSIASLPSLSPGCKCLIALLQLFAGGDGLWGDKASDDATLYRLADSLGVSVDTIRDRLKTLQDCGFVRSWDRTKLNREGCQQFKFSVCPYPEGEEFVCLDLPILRIPPGIVSDGAKLIRGLLRRRAGLNGRAFPGYRNIGKTLGYKRSHVTEKLKEAEKKLGVSHQRRRRSSNIYTILPVDQIELAQKSWPSSYDSGRRSELEKQQHSRDEASSKSQSKPSGFPLSPGTENIGVDPGHQGLEDCGNQETRIPAVKDWRIAASEESTDKKEPLINTDVVVDLDSAQRSHKHRDIASARGTVDEGQFLADLAECQPLGDVIAELVKKRPGINERPCNQFLLDLRRAAPDYTIGEIISCLSQRALNAKYANKRPETFSWFMTTLRNDVAQRRSLLPSHCYATSPSLSTALVNDMASAFDPFLESSKPAAAPGDPKTKIPISEQEVKKHPPKTQTAAGDEYVLPASFNYDKALVQKVYPAFGYDSALSRDSDEDCCTFEAERDVAHIKGVNKRPGSPKLKDVHTTKAPFTASELRFYLEQAAEALAYHSDPSIQAKADILRLIAANAQTHLQNIGELQCRLSGIEDEVIRIAHALISEEDLCAIRAPLDRELEPYRGRMTADQISMLKRRYVDSAILETAKLPRLSLFYLH